MEAEPVKNELQGNAELIAILLVEKAADKVPKGPPTVTESSKLPFLIVREMLVTDVAEFQPVHIIVVTPIRPRAEN